MNFEDPFAKKPIENFSQCNLNYQSDKIGLFFYGSLFVQSG